MLEIPFRNIPVYRLLTFRSLAAVFLLAAASASSLVASAQNAVFKIAPVNIPLEVKDQPITITASATLTISSRDRDVRIFRLELTGDLVDLQRNLTQLLSSQMNKNDDCGEILTIQNATLTPVDPASLAMVQLHYERRTCVKLFGKRQAKRLVSGDAQIEIRLTPEIEENSTQLRLAVEVGQIQATGSLGDLLRSGPLGEALREKVRSAILAALQKGTDLSATLPPAAQGYASIENAEFKDAGDGHLLVVLSGQVRLTQEQVLALSSEVKERLAHR